MKKTPMLATVPGKEMRNCLIIFCLVLLMTPAVAGADAPAVTGITPSSGFNTTTVSITDLSGANFTSGAMVILTPDTANPVHKGSIANGAGGADLTSPFAVSIKGTYAYIASTGSNALEIVDISNPAAPVHKSSLKLGPTGWDPYDIYVSGNYAYITISAGSIGVNALTIVDVTDPAAPFLRGIINNNDGGASLYPVSYTHLT